MAFTHTGMMLGFKLADVVAHTNPEAIFLFGGLALARDLIFEPAKQYMEENLLGIYKGKVKLLPSELKYPECRSTWCKFTYLVNEQIMIPK